MTAVSAEPLAPDEAASDPVPPGRGVRPPGVRLVPLEPKRDVRGHLVEVFRSDRVPGLACEQVNAMFSRGGCLRGTHVHATHWDLLTLPSGRACVGVRDMRRASPCFGRTWCVELNPEVALVVPPGVAHAVAFREDSVLVTIESAAYDPEDEIKLAWRDLEVAWPADLAIEDAGPSGASWNAALERMASWQADWASQLPFLA
jgi:dTDP-4-dehydrorhamnose 3,5-epimerase-like enzyme